MYVQSTLEQETLTVNMADGLKKQLVPPSPILYFPTSGPTLIFSFGDIC